MQSEQSGRDRRKSDAYGGVPLISEDLFKGALIREYKRADRSCQPLALMLVSLMAPTEAESTPIWRVTVGALSNIKRDTDIVGWFETDQTLGVILADVPATPDFLHDVAERIRRELARCLGPQTARRLLVRLHVHPEPGAAADGGWSVDPVIARVLRGDTLRPYDVVKRAIDVAFSLTLLVMLSPLLVAVATLVKLTSKGPIFFRQERVGQMMAPFTMLKFRTMQVNNDHAIHHAFVSSFIKPETHADRRDTNQVFKIANDPRVTPVGKFLRRSSLDELPQVWNVLRGDMSLVGPRPPIQYEVDQYKSWHTRRVVEVKPGITGLWQVRGRSRTTFDEMVRLDLQYARTYSFWTDVKILLATPGAMLSGKGAC
jgi:lipopolysaccharide/colanic/teichoic acid biosynthesis glycosyltransferase